jgi:hypothetical protein
MSRQRVEFLVYLVVGLTCVVTGRTAHAQSSIGAVTQRPFVVGVVPVVGNGAVGGVAIDANGAVEAAEQRDLVALRAAWTKPPIFVQKNRLARKRTKVSGLCQTSQRFPAQPSSHKMSQT